MEEELTNEPKVVRKQQLSFGRKKIRSKRMMLISRLKRKLMNHVWAVRLVVLGLVLAALFIIGIIVILVLNSLGFSKYFHYASTFLFTPESKIASIGGHTNILILGKGGTGHEAPDLTDTIMFASIDHKGGKITLISLPRDIWMTDLRAKLNSAYYWGNQKTPGGGLILAKATVEEIVGEPIQYAMVVDMSGLTEAIDILGGVEVNVETGFTDNKFPVVGREADTCDGDRELKCRYETVTFEKGLQIMDGATALKFIRSRNAEGDEGTDFARAKRQQVVLEAIEKKISGREVIFSVSKIRKLLELFGKVVETDINDDAGVILARRILETKSNRRSYTLGEEFLINPPISPKYDNLYVFIPKDEDWSDIHDWIESLIRG